MHATAVSLPVFGEWPAWMTVLTVGLLLLFVLQRVLHLVDPGPTDESSDVRLPGDVSTLRGWDEFVMGQRLERECRPEQQDDQT